MQIVQCPSNCFAHVVHCAVATLGVISSREYEHIVAILCQAMHIVREDDTTNPQSTNKTCSIRVSRTLDSTRANIRSQIRDNTQKQSPRNVRDQTLQNSREKPGDTPREQSLEYTRGQTVPRDQTRDQTLEYTRDQTQEYKRDPIRAPPTQLRTADKFFSQGFDAAPTTNRIPDAKIAVRCGDDNFATKSNKENSHGRTRAAHGMFLRYVSV